MHNYFEVKLADGRTVLMAGTDGVHACQRAADLYNTDAVAWRNPPTYVGPVHHSQIIG